MSATSKISTIAVILAFMISGCVPAMVWKSVPAYQTAENEFFSATITPSSCSYLGCGSFLLSVTNKTNKNIELDWNKTLYIKNNQTSGGFMYEGVIYKDRNNPKSPDVIFSGGVLSKTIWPNNLVSFSSGRYGGWNNGGMPSGENGIYLTMVVDGKEVSEKLTMLLSASQVSNQ